MLRLVLLAATALATGLQTRETVQRLVMVRTSGSDLQPAATGYRYSKDDDGPESVVQMRESEVMEHLAKLYTRPAHHEHDANKADANERVIPVKETHEEHVDGIADVDYKKIFDDYGADYGHHRSYDDYLKDLKRFKGGLYRKYDGDSAEDDKRSERHKHGKGNAKSYHDEKFESYSISGGHKKHQDDGGAHSAHEKHYDHRGSEKDGQDAIGGARSFHSVYDDDKHDHQYVGKGGRAFTDGRQYDGAGDGAHDYHDHEYQPKHYAAKAERKHSEDQRDKSAQQADSHSSDESTTSDETPGEVGAEDGQAGGSSFGYEVKH